MCLERLAIPQQKRVGEGAVAPVDTAPMQLHEQAGHGVQEPLAVVERGLRQPPEESSELQRTHEVAGDDDRGIVIGTLDEAHRAHRGGIPLLELAHHLVFPTRRSHRQLLERQQLRIEGDEADHVPTLAHGQLHEPSRIRWPLLERHRPRQLEQGRRVAPEAHQDARSGVGHVQRSKGPSGGRPSM